MAPGALDQNSDPLIDLLFTMGEVAVLSGNRMCASSADNPAIGQSLCFARQLLQGD